MNKISLTIVQILLSFVVFCQNQAETVNISVSEIKEHITFLASDSLRGRFPGTDGDKSAANYIRNHFRDAGLRLLFDNGFQNFEVTTGIRASINNTLSFNGYNAIFDKEFRPLNFSSSVSLEAPVVFAGYGFSIETDSLKWDDYKFIDAKGKWVIIMTGSPKKEMENFTLGFLKVFEKYTDLRNKALTAKDKGAAGVLFVTGLKSGDKEELIPLRFDQSKSNSGIPVISITRTLADKLLARVPGKKTIEFLENSINFTMQPVSFDANIIMKANTDVQPVKAITENVVAIIDGTQAGRSNEYIIVGAHFDHLGMGGKETKSRKPDTVAVHNGADDNASGVAGIIELAEKLASAKPIAGRSIIFVAFSGEELGILGSKYFIANPPVEKKQIKAMLNFDMIGRFRPAEKPLLISGTGTATEFDSILTATNKLYNIPLKFSAGGQEGSDQAAFYSENIPVLFFNSGMHNQYHTPEDDVNLINFEGEKEILDYACELIIKLATVDCTFAFHEAGEKRQSGGDARFKITLGIMPDYSSGNVIGLMVDDVRTGGPAEKAGIKKGDIIIAVDGKSISNIYDYMSRLKTLEAGNITKVEVLRNNEKVIVEVQL